jgi:MoxR-like ATPase
MYTLSVSESEKVLDKIIASGNKRSLMMWGAPGIGKSSIVNQVAKKHKMEVIDLRLSQLAPTDIRGLPFVENGVARFAPPSFLPQSGSGILFLDEINLAAPAIQNVAMQLVLDRRVGDYVVPDSWFIVSAGNRVEDRAAVNQMPAPLTNRFNHMTVEVDLVSWKSYAITNGIREEIISFMNFKPNLLHNFSKNAIAWPSPRTWEMASELLDIGLGVEAAVGEGAASEFNSFKRLYSRLPDVDKILQGDKSVKAPKEPSLLYAITGSLVSRSQTPENFFNSLKWLLGATTEDYCGVFMSDALVAVNAKGFRGKFVELLVSDPVTKQFGPKYQDLLQGVSA